MEQTTSQMKAWDVIIVGGGLSGLYVATHLPSNVEWTLLEASAVLGGRLANNHPPVNSSHSAGGEIDMGGAWIWPDVQPHVNELVKDLGVSTFLQPGDSSSTRIVGGAVEFTKRLASRVDAGNIYTNCAVCKCSLLEDEDVVQVETVNGKIFKAKTVVFAMPPKLLWKAVTFDPPLSKEKQEAMQKAETWMAGVTKVALVYPKRFWDVAASNTGFPTSVDGPAFQVYDSSTHDDTIGAITFFTLASTDDDSELATQVANQMASFWKLHRLPYWNEARSYSSFHIHRWPKHPFISDNANPARIHPHPAPVRSLAAPEWANRLLFAGTETDLVSPGVMEGAIGASIRVLKSIIRKR
jgi:monoamine oxidase